MKRHACISLLVLAISLIVLSCSLDVNRDNIFDPEGGNYIGLLGAWTFEEGAGTTVADSSVNNYAGTVDMQGDAWDYNNISPYSTSHRHSLYFEDSDDNSARKVTIGDVDAFDFSETDSTITIEAVIYIYYSGQIISKYDGTDGWYFRVWGAYPFELSFFASGSSGNAIELSMPTGVLNYNQWYHVACTIDIKNKDYRFYVDGESQTVSIDSDSFTTGETIETTTSSVLIGASEASGGEVLNQGYIDEVLIYNKILSPDMIASHSEGEY